MSDLDAETLFVRFKAQLDSIDQMKNDFKGAHESMAEIVDKFQKHARDEAKKTMDAYENMGQGMEKSVKKASSGITNSMKEIGNALGINVGKFATVAGGVLSMVAFMDEVRKMASAQILATSMVTGSNNIGTKQQAGQYGMFQAGMRSYYGMMGLGTEEEVAKVSGQLITTRGVGKADLFGKGGTVEQALLMGRSTGMGSDVVGGMFSTMISKLDVPAERVGETFAHLYDMGKKVGNVNGEYVRDVINISSQLKSYGISQEVVSQSLQDFWVDIDKGKLSIQDLTKAFTMARSMSEGQRAFAGTQVLSRDKMLSGYLANQDIITVQARVQELLEGGIIGGSHRVTKGEQNTAIKDIFKDADERARNILKQSGIAVTPENLNYYQQKMLQSTTGVNFQNLSIEEQHKLMNEFKSGKFSAEGSDIFKKGKSSEFEQLMDIGKTLGRIEKGPLEAIKDLMGHVTIMLGGFLLGAASWALPAKEKAFVQGMIQHETPGAMAWEDSIRNMSNQEETFGGSSTLGMNYLRGSLSHKQDISKAISRVEAGKDKQLKRGVEDALKFLHIAVTVKGELKHDGRIVTEAQLEKAIEGHASWSNDTNSPPSSVPGGK